MIRIHSPSHSLISAKYFENCSQNNKRKLGLILKSTLRTSLPNIVHLSRHLTELNKFEIGSDRFEKLSKAVSVCPMLELFDDATGNPCLAVERFNFPSYYVLIG